MSDTYITNITGLLDVEAMVKNLTLSKQKRLQKLAQDKALLQAKVSALNNFLSSLKDLQNQVNSLKIDDLFKGKRINISDTTVLSAQATENTPNLTLRLKVEQLAQGEIRATSGGVENLNQTLSPTTITLKYWTSENNVEERTINFTGGPLQDLVRTINESQNKVSASIYFDGVNYKLMLAEKDLGASTVETSSTKFAIEALGLPTELGALELTLQEARNAKILIGSDSGTAITSPTNTFKEVISGLDITALKPSTDFITLSIDDSYEKVSSSLSDLFNKINNVLSLLQELTGKGSIFQGNAVLTRIKVQLLTATNPLQNLGIININEGKYSLNSEALNNLLQKGQLEEIKKALEQTKDLAQKLLGSTVKILETFIKVEDKQIQNLDIKAEILQKNLRREEEKLRLTFSKIENLMYQNEKLRNRLENFMVSLSENKK